MRALFAGLFLALGCATSASTGVTASPAAGPATPGGAADHSYRLLEGRFDSADQARSTPGYPAIQVVACPAEVPSLGPRVLYVEQTRMDAADRPERQRVYVIEPGEPVESAAVARVFDLAVPGSSVGACGLSVRPRFTRDELVERVGCTVSLRSDGPVYRGSTSGRGCPTNLKGATYVTSDVVLDTFGLRSWERGFDPSGAQRWGSESGPYVFVRRSPIPSP
jgi:CpeT protein